MVRRSAPPPGVRWSTCSVAWLSALITWFANSTRHSFTLVTVARTVIDAPARHAALAAGAVGHASGFGWDATVERVLEVYSQL